MQLQHAAARSRLRPAAAPGSVGAPRAAPSPTARPAPTLPSGGTLVLAAKPGRPRGAGRPGAWGAAMAAACEAWGGRASPGAGGPPPPPARWLDVSSRALDAAHAPTAATTRAHATTLPPSLLQPAPSPAPRPRAAWPTPPCARRGRTSRNRRARGLPARTASCCTTTTSTAGSTSCASCSRSGGEGEWAGRRMGAAGGEPEKKQNSKDTPPPNAHHHLPSPRCRSSTASPWTTPSPAWRKRTRTARRPSSRAGSPTRSATAKGCARRGSSPPSSPRAREEELGGATEGEGEGGGVCSGWRAPPRPRALRTIFGEAVLAVGRWARPGGRSACEGRFIFLSAGRRRAAAGPSLSSPPPATRHPPLAAGGPGVRNKPAAAGCSLAAQRPSLSLSPPLRRPPPLSPSLSAPPFPAPPMLAVRPSPRRPAAAGRAPAAAVGARPSFAASSRAQLASFARIAAPGEREGGDGPDGAAVGRGGGHSVRPGVRRAAGAPTARAARPPAATRIGASNHAIALHHHPPSPRPRARRGRDGQQRVRRPVLPPGESRADRDWAEGVQPAARQGHLGALPG